MKKIIISSVIVICVLIISIVIILNKGSDNPSEISEDFIELTGVEFSVTYLEDTNELTYTIKNLNDFTIEFGEPYSLEMQKNNDWYQLNPDQSWILIMYSLNQNEEKTSTVSLNQNLKPGKYRLVKTVNVPNNEAKGNTIIAYFEL